MTVITNNSITGINSITAQASTLNFYDTNGGQISIGASITGDVTGNVTGNVTGDIVIGAGSTSAPSLAPSGDSNTGIFFPSADTIAFAEGGSEAARIDSSGRLLVGTSTAASAGSWAQYAKISTQGNTASSTGGGVVNISTGSAASSGISAGISIGNVSFSDNGGNEFALIECRTDDTTGSSDYPGRLIFSTTENGASSPTERMRITNNGYLKASNTGSYIDAARGIHEFVSNRSDWTARMYTSGSTPEGLEIKYTSAAPNTTTSPFLYCVDNSQLRLSVRSNGGIANFQSNNANICDEREKKNIVDLDSTWDCLKNWELKKFHYNEDADDADLRYGVIAQQVAPHCPEVIADWVKQDAVEAVLDEDGNVVTPAQEEIVRMGVKEQQMMWMAIKALQEAQTRIETLETQNAAILARLDAAGI